MRFIKLEHNPPSGKEVLHINTEHILFVAVINDAVPPRAVIVFKDDTKLTVIGESAIYKLEQLGLSS